MCECGCSAFTADAKFPGPDGSTYVVRVFPGCSNGCGRVAGVDIFRLEPRAHVDLPRELADDILESIEGTPALEFHDGAGIPMAGIPVLDAELLTKHMIQHGADEVEADEFVESAFIDAVHATVDYYERIGRDADADDQPTAEVEAIPS